jgi:ABC-type lipoprotein export system ATPase subunit
MTEVSKEYPSLPQPVRVLQDITFQVNAGECVAIVGPSGSGKSTLLNLMGTLDTATSGRILFKDRDIAGLSPRDLAQVRNREIGFVFQLHHLLPQCTVLENVLVPALVNADTHDAYERAVKLLERVGLNDRLHHRPGQLSGGERQRAAVVRALINRPSLLLADEPTGSLNEEGAAHLADLILELNREEGMAVVFVTHSLSIAERIGRIQELRGGQLVPRE